MAVVITVAEFAAALRLSDDAAELAEATRLLQYATVAVVERAPNAPDVVHSEACIRLGAFMFDRPNADRRAGWSNAIRQSGAGSILQPYRQSPVTTDADA